MSDITVCIPTLNRYDLLHRCVETLYSGTIIPKEVVIINNGTGELKPTNSVKVHSFGENLGVSKSWNWFINNLELPLLICNDDLEFGKDDLALFQQYYYSNKAEFYYPENINHLNVFSCFMLTKECLEKVGLFDEEFKRAYFEDNDYFYRMLLAGIKIMPVPTKIQHLQSGTFKALSKLEEKQHHRMFEANRDYYKKKWGGYPHHEVYRSPFNK